MLEKCQSKVGQIGENHTSNAEQALGVSTSLQIIFPASGKLIYYLGVATGGH